MLAILGPSRHIVAIDDALVHATMPADQRRSLTSPTRNLIRPDDDRLDGFYRDDAVGDYSMATGTVKWFNTQKGYGFIQPDDGGNDVFVHISAVEGAGLMSLNEGQKISYELEKGRNGKFAAVDLKAE